jgi:formylmethanofuran dehydrogenase subunit B
MSPLLGGFEAEFIKSNTVTPQCGGQCDQLEVRVKTKASPVQEVIKKLLGSQ